MRKPKKATDVETALYILRHMRDHHYKPNTKSSTDGDDLNDMNRWALDYAIDAILAAREANHG